MFLLSGTSPLLLGPFVTVGVSHFQGNAVQTTSLTCTCIVLIVSGTGESMGGGGGGGGGVSGGPCNVEQVLCVGMGLNGKKPHIMVS